MITIYSNQPQKIVNNLAPTVNKNNTSQQSGKQPPLTPLVLIGSEQKKVKKCSVLMCIYLDLKIINKTYPADCRNTAAVDSNKHDWD